MIKGNISYEQGGTMKRFYTYGIVQGIGGGFFLPLWILFLVDSNVSILYIGLLGTILEIVRFITEVPLGGFADHFGRKTSLLLGAAFNAISIALFIFSTNNSLLFLSIIFMGLGNSFESGSLEAWVVDYLKLNKAEESINLHLTRIYIFLMGGSIIGALCTGWLYSTNNKVPFILASIFSLSLFAFILFFMKEDFANKKEFSIKSNVREIKNNIYNSYKFTISTFNLKLFLFSALFYSWAVDGIERFYQPFLSSLGFKPSNISLIFVLSSSLAIILLFIQNRIYEKIKNEITVLVIIKILMITSIILSTTLNTKFAFVFIVLFLSLVTLTRPITQSYLNKYIPTEIRATTLSFFELIGSLGEVFAGITIGFIIDKLNMVTGIRTSSMLIVISIVFIVIISYSKKKTERRGI